MIESLFTFGLTQRKFVALLVVLLTVPLFFGVARLEVDTSFNSLIPADEPDKLAYQRTMDQFGSDNKTIIYVRDENLWTQEKLTHLGRIFQRQKCLVQRFRRCFQRLLLLFTVLFHSLIACNSVLIH